MPYKPKYCCQCGEKIDRLDWKPWTSRRFCELCETEFGIYDKLRGLLVGIALLFGLYGIGSYFYKPEKQLNIASSQFVASNINSSANHSKANAQVPVNASVQAPVLASNSVAQAKLPPDTIKPDLKIKQIETQTAALAEKVYFCGATTKKGMMCSRRVKNGGRCWQHAGQAAQLPQEKLLAAR